MLSRHREPGEPNLIATIRDVVEIVAIVAAGAWAFYIFVYENRIKPSFANPDVNVTASMHRLSTHNGLTAVGLRVQLHNVGTVPARFLAVVINVYGQHVAAQTPGPRPKDVGIEYDRSDFSRSDAPVAVYTWAYVTRQGNAKSGKETGLDPDTTIENVRIFYVPQGKFDLLTLGIDAPYTKSDDFVPVSLKFKPNGGIETVTADLSRLQRFNIATATSLDIR